MSSRCGVWVLLWLVWAGAAGAQQADMLLGQVRDPDGQPVMGARVEALSLETELTRSVMTGRDGRYLITFPDGGGIYVLRVSFIGMADDLRPVLREAAEELLVANITLQPQAIGLDEILVSVQGTSENWETGAEGVTLSRDLLGRLPLADMEPETIALLMAGVVGTTVDSLSERMQFSVGGMREELNQFTFDGIALADDAVLGVPEEGLRRVEVTTNTFDASRGGFAGGEVRMTSARGNNQSSGSFTYRLDSDALQLRAVPSANPYVRHNIGGSWSGPLIQNRLFYNASFQVTRNQSQRFALAAGDPLAAQRSGVSADSIARFLSILEGYDAFPVDGQTGGYSQRSSDLRLQGRLDWNIVQGNAQSHSLSARINTNLNSQDSTRISTLDLMQHGGETGRNTRQGSVNLTSRFGQGWTNSLNVSYQDNWSDALPYVELPQGQIRVTSDFEDGTRGSRSLVFGGNRNMPTEASGQTFSVSEELSMVLPFGEQIHRLKIGGSWDGNRSENRSTANLFGSFRFESLEDFQANRPDRFERTLTPREEDSGRMSASLFLTDTWRVSQPLELTLGLRWDYSRLRERPDYNPAVQEVFGVRTDIVPGSAAWSPRLGFSYTLPQAGGGRGGGRRSLTGGIGYFAGRAPTNIFSAAMRQTGLPNAEISLICIGSAVPVPDWDLYRTDPTAVPSECSDGAGGALSQSSRAPAVTVVRPGQPLPGSLRLDLGYRTPLPLGLNGNFRYQYSLGRGLWGYQDLNLDASNVVHLGPDERAFFGDPASITARTGAVSMASSRLDPAFANVYEVSSALRSVSHQLTAQINGTLPPRINTRLNYTLSFARDQGSGSLQGVTTAGNPNEVEWGTANNDRRHSINLSVTLPLTQSLEISANSRIQSGQPFTPLANRDINGDGLRNDRAFVFDPLATADTALAQGMQRLLTNVGGNVRDCLEQQFGSVAARNSCRGSWTQSLNMAVNVRPNLPTLQRRMTVTANVQNVLTGLDYLLHGAGGMRGWGEGQRADANLLQVSGFNHASNAFVYRINEGFGQDNRGPDSFRNAFSLNLSARVSLGGNPAQASRGFLGGGGGGGGGGGVGRGGQAGPGGQGGRGGGAASFQLPALAALFRAQQTEDPDVDAIVVALLANPVERVLELGDSLGLSEQQSSSLEAESAALQSLLDARREPLTNGLWGLAPAILSPDASFFGSQSETPREFQAEVQPQVDGARAEARSALGRVQRTLDEEQWTMLPQDIRSLLQQGGGATQAPFSAVTTLDRMLANPLPVLLDLRDIISISGEQVRALEALSTTLQESLDRRRVTLGSRFDNLPPEEQARVFQEVQPEIEEGREEIRAALRSAEAILTVEQWGQLPAAIRDPFTRQSAPGSGAPPPTP